MEYTVTVKLPKHLYERLETQSRSVASPVDEIVVQTLARTLPPIVEKDLSPALQMELTALEHLSDDALWQIARSTMNCDKVALYDVLLDRHQAGALTPEGQEWLTHLREEAEALMLRKAHAYALLQSRGHQLPSLQELDIQTE
jgi:hypothetical protein